VLVVQLANVQSAAGTAYPQFSSLRADAQGLKALHDVVELVGRQATRNYLPPDALQVRNTTIIRLGFTTGTLAIASHPGPEKPAALAAAGNTVILGITGDCHYATIKEWQLTLQCGDEGAFFDGPSWRVLETDGQQHARVVERQFGSGEIILLANSRMLNNAALARRARAALVAMLVERRPTVMFDEQHLGVADSTSVGKLLRHYRLHGVLLAGLLLFGVFVWRNTSSFLPRVEASADEIFGRDATAGLANLLRRTAPRGELLSIAVGEWAKAERNPDRQEEIRRIAASHTDPVEGYNAVAAALHQQRTIG
jgi:hypothetical protein